MKFLFWNNDTQVNTDACPVCGYHTMETKHARREYSAFHARELTVRIIVCPQCDHKREVRE